MSPATSRGEPSLGRRCIRRSGEALIAITAPDASPATSGWRMSGSRRSIPHTSSPVMAATRAHTRATAGWTEPVTSLLVPPAERLALWRNVTICPTAGTDVGARP